MVRFSKDVDLLKWEPVLFREAGYAAQQLCKGTDGVVADTTFTSASGSFVSGAVKAGQVVYVSDGMGVIDGCYEIVSVDSETELTVSVVRVSDEDKVVAPPAGSELHYRISTYNAQADEAAYSLLQYFGVSEEEAETGAILNERALRQSSVFAILSAVLAGCASGQDDGRGFWEKSLRYQKLYEQSRTKVCLELDDDSDAIADRKNSGGSIRMKRV